MQTRVGAAGVDPNTPAAWSDTHWRRISGIAPTAIDDGPTGTWLLTRDIARSRPPVQNDYAVRLWRWGTGGFGLARRAGALNRPQSQPIGYGDGDSSVALDVDLAGRRIRAVPLVTPPLGSRVGSLRIGRRRVSIPDFYACTPTGTVFKHRLKLDGRRGAKIVSVRFFFDDGQPTATDPSAPYRRDFTLTFAPGTRHVAAAVVSYRRPGSRRLRTVRIGRTFVMC